MLNNNEIISFEVPYNECLINLGLVEGKAKGKTFIGKKRFFRFLGPKIIGEVVEKPILTFEGLVGEFRVIAYEVKSLMWDLAENIETRCGVQSEVSISIPRER